MRITAARARSFAARAFKALGVPAADARTAARLLVRTDMRGVRTHGLKLIPSYAARLQNGGVTSNPRIRRIKRAAWGGVIDGDASLGQIGASEALRIAINAADSRGLGMAVCRNTSHVGALGPYLLDAVRGRVVLAMTNTSASVAPPGGNFAAIGNNCIGFAAPIRAAAPLCLDMTTSYESWGKIHDRRERGASLPTGIALNPDGSWATDPAAAIAHTVAAPLGGAKGFGLAMMIDIVTAGISGGNFSPQLNLLREALDEPEGTCCAFLVLSLKHMPGGRSMPHRLAEWRAEIKAGKRAGKESIRLPGERAHDEELRCKRDGIPIAPILRRELIDLAALYNVRHPF